MHPDKVALGIGRRPLSIGVRATVVLATMLALAGAPRATAQVTAEESSAPGQDAARPFGIRFEEVTATAGVDFRHERAASREKLYLETMGAGVGWLDYDQDGLLDLLFVNSGATPHFAPPDTPQPALYRNQGDGGFVDVTERSGLTVGPGFFFFGVAAGDYDNDGHPDIYLSGYRRSLLYRNTGRGSFEDVTATAGVGHEGAWATAAGWFDYDRDGDIDLLVTSYVQYDVERNVVCGDPTPERRAYCHPDSFPGTSPRLYRNNGDGTFTDVTEPAQLVNPDGKSLAVALADLDGDDWTDIFIANDTQRNFIYFNQGDGTFEDASYLSGAGFSEDGKAEAGMSAGAADIDLDGDIDLYVSHLDAELNRLYVNEGNRLFVDTTIGSGLGATNIMNSAFGAQFLDADNDSHRDLLVINGHIMDNISIYHAGVTYAESKRLYRNLGSGRFDDVSATQPEEFLEPRVGRGLAVGDFDNDGFPDFAVNNNGELGQLFRNSGEGEAHWMGVHLQGVISARDAVGAKLELATSSHLSYDQIMGGRSYCSAQDLRALFGLGAALRVEHLEVRWPSGRRQRLLDVPRNTYLHLLEGG